MDKAPGQMAPLSSTRRELLKILLAERSIKGPVEQEIPRRNLTGPLPLSFGQEGLWFLDQLVPGNIFYNVPLTVSVAGKLDVAVLKQSLQALVRRHEVLRTVFSALDGCPVQLVQPDQLIPFLVLDLSGRTSGEAQNREVEHLMQEEAERPFDLSQGPLLRAILLRLAEQEHLLLLTIHHIAWDGWSLEVFRRELIALYVSIAAHQPSPLPALPIQYTDFALWQRQRLQGNILEENLSYWKTRLAGASLSITLPFARPRPQAPTLRREVEAFHFPPKLLQRLQMLGQQEGVTLYIVLLASFKTLLYRYTEQADITIGTVVAGRTRSETERLIGFFVNILALRTDFSGNPPFRELLARVGEAALGGYDHQEMPFERLVEELRPERDPNAHPLVQMLFVQQPMQEVLFTGPDVSFRFALRDSGQSQFDLETHLWETSEGLQCMFKYSLDRFNRAQILRLGEHYLRVLEGIAADPERRILDLPLLTERESAQIVSWNATQTRYPKDQCIHHLFEAQAEQAPDAIAAVFDHQSLTYGQLNEIANQLAHFLQQLGVRTETRIGLCLESGMEFIIGVSGILKAGGTYVPLDPSYPKERLAFLLTDTQAPVVLTRRALHSLLPQHDLQIIDLDEHWNTIRQQPRQSPISLASAESLAYIMYTSGSTGVPKGIGIPHRAIVHLVCQTNYLHIKPQDCLSMASNVSFDASTFEIWGALSNGARLTGIPQTTLLSPVALAACIQTYQITILFLTTALFNQIASELPQAFGQLHHLLVGGEAHNPQKLRAVLAAQPPGCLLNVYGPTETTTFASWFEIKQVSEDATTIPIGYPLANTELYALDSHLHPTPVGIPGELYIGGDGLARGYLHRPDLTAERFVPHPFSTQPGARLYRTGDLVQQEADGSLVFMGRRDGQIKLRGYRIECGEIEHWLLRYPQVQEAIVLLREDRPDDKRLVAYVVAETLARASEPPSSDQLRAYLQEHLPAYMLPSAFIWLPRLPLSSNGKLNRQALPLPQWEQNAPSQYKQAPQTPVEEVLAEIWQEVLGITSVSREANFFDLGGHSLLIPRVQSRLQKRLTKVVPIVKLFEHPTIDSLAAYLSQEQGEQPGFSPVYDRARKQRIATQKQKQALRQKRGENV